MLLNGNQKLIFYKKKKLINFYLILREFNNYYKLDFLYKFINYKTKKN